MLGPFYYPLLTAMWHRSGGAAPPRGCRGPSWPGPLVVKFCQAARILASSPSLVVAMAGTIVEEEFEARQIRLPAAGGANPPGSAYAGRSR
jgi:hypothetical protein